MNSTATGAVAPQQAETELKIEIRPRSYDERVGTSQALIAEGVVAEGVSWPEGKSRLYWKDSNFEYELGRCRPAGHKGPASSWMGANNWCFRRRAIEYGGMGLGASKLFEAKRAFERELRSQTKEGCRERAAFHRSLLDGSYQDFRAKLMPQRKRAPRV